MNHMIPPKNNMSINKYFNISFDIEKLFCIIKSRKEVIHMDTKYISYAINEELHQKLKEHCAKNKTTIKDFLTSLIQRALGETEKTK